MELNFRDINISLENQIDAEAAFFSLVSGLFIAWSHYSEKFGINSFAALESYSMLMNIKRDYTEEYRVTLEEICKSNKWNIPDELKANTPIDDFLTNEDGGGKSTDIDN